MALKNTVALKEPIEINEVLYRKMKEIYAEYTGQQIADVIGVIRREINDDQELIRRREELAKLGIKG